MTENLRLEDHLETITKATRRYIGPLTPREDLVQEGILTFYSAREDWDPERMRKFKAYLWYRCVGRYAYLKYAAHRDAGRLDALDDVPHRVFCADIYPADYAPSPERETRFRLAIARCSPDARKVIHLVFDPPPALHRRLNKEGLRKYLLRHPTLMGTDQRRISDAFHNIAYALRQV